MPNAAGCRSQSQQRLHHRRCPLAQLLVPISQLNRTWSGLTKHAASSARCICPALSVRPPPRPCVPQLLELAGICFEQRHRFLQRPQLALGLLRPLVPSACLVADVLAILQDYTSFDDPVCADICLEHLVQGLPLAISNVHCMPLPINNAASPVMYEWASAWLFLLSPVILTPGF
jgi:hypothetical protein